MGKKDGNRTGVPGEQAEVSAVPRNALVRLALKKLKESCRPQDSKQKGTL